MVTETLAPNTEFETVATDEQIERAAEGLRSRGIEAILVENGEEARKLVFEMVPEGAEVNGGASATLQAIGVTEQLMSGRYDYLRPKLFQMDRATQADEIRKLGASPAFFVGSVHALTESGQAITASMGGSQLGPYVSGAGKVIWVIGAQKIVPNTEEGLRRIEEYSYPREDARAREVYGVPSGINKILIVNREVFPGRITAIIAKERLGF